MKAICSRLTLPGLLVAAMTSAGAAPTLTSTGIEAKLASPVLPAKSVILWDQLDNDDGIATVSQNFESSFDAYDSAAADDFIVPAGQKWKISDIYVGGQYFNGSGPADSFGILFYNDKSHSGRVSIDIPNIPKEYCPPPGWQWVGAGGYYHFHCAKPVVFKPGTYWLSVVANMNFSTGGEWGWENRAATNASAAVWQNPNGGFATGCATWTAENVCIPNGQGDHMFQLQGKAK